MICLGVDPGQSRVGLALGQDSLAIALETVEMGKAIDRISDLVREKKAERVYVGLPISLSGSSTPSTKYAIDFAKEVSEKVEVPVFVIDERLTTTQSTRLSQSAGKSSRDSKSFIDAEAARLIVDSAITSKHQAGMELGDYLARNE